MLCETGTCCAQNIESRPFFFLVSILGLSGQSGESSFRGRQEAGALVPKEASAGAHAAPLVGPGVLFRWGPEESPF